MKKEKDQLLGKVKIISYLFLHGMKITQQDIRFDGRILSQREVQRNLAIAVFIKARAILRHTRKVPLPHGNQFIAPRNVGGMD